QARSIVRAPSLPASFQAAMALLAGARSHRTPAGSCQLARAPASSADSSDAARGDFNVAASKTCMRPLLFLTATRVLPWNSKTTGDDVNSPPSDLKIARGSSAAGASDTSSLPAAA